MKRITPWLWFDGRAEEAARFYASVFPNSRITGTMPGPGGRPLTVSFQLDGQEFVALNGGPEFRFTEAVSFAVTCADQAEIDRFWAALVEGGEESVGGWLKDRYGLSWQIIPADLGEILKAPGAMQRLLAMRKIDVAKLRAGG